ncbi:hypothetical protein MLD38_018605 [Melastoma candidum]|uniref:Uncharacterized protein n=1 Tax=Melastoma candidum TaxID=119954 RepID=A0ACB9QUW5_9MYRT|nr:hypothetical protein MLD38_018605 [Melastoma candidum]
MEGQQYQGELLAYLQSTMRAIEAACTSIQMHTNPAAAEATILSLSRSPQPYKACKFIMENSQLANARFQAAGALRDAAIREWSFLSSDDRNNLINFCLNFVFQHAGSPEGYVQAKVSSVAAQLLKRGWLEFSVSEKERFFYQVNQAILGSHGLQVQFVSINFLESLVSEFSPTTSSAMGLPREFIEQCRKSIELDYLKVFYCWTRDAALGVAARIIESDSGTDEVKVCTAALRFMLQIMTWEFRYSSNSVKNINIFSDAIRPDNTLLNRTECIVVQPGPAWREVLLSSGHAIWLVKLYSALRQKFSRDGFWIDCPIAVAARKVILQFCSLAGTVFPSDGGRLHEHHLLQLLSGVIKWIDPPDAVSKEIESGKSSSELLDGCRALYAMATVTTPSTFDKLLKSMRPYGTLMLFSNLMCEVLKVLMTKESDEETWSWEARDILLDTWTAILTTSSGSSENATLPPEGVHAAASVFLLIVESELKGACASVFNDDSASDYLHASISAMDERLASYALIARAATDVTVPLLTSLFNDRLSRLHQGRGIVDPTETMEELYSLLLLIGHVIADEGEGETPLVPNAIQRHFLDYVEAEKHPVVVLSSSVIRFAEQSLDPEARSSIFSPRLMEAIIWFLARWALSYLMSPEEYKEANHDSGLGSTNQIQSYGSKGIILKFFSEYGNGKTVLDIIVRVCATTLLSYPGENFLQGLTCCQLLHALVRQKNICVHLVELESWRDLGHTFANEKILFMLNASHQKSLAQTFILSTAGVKNSDTANQYVRNVTSHMTTYLAELCDKRDLRSIAEQPDIILLVTCLLERLRGAAGACEPRIQKSLYEMGLSVLKAILVLLEIYKHESAVVYLLLKFVVDWVDGQITHLEAQETSIVVDFCMRLLQLYSSLNIGKISLSTSSALLSDAETDKCKDLRALLQLLSGLCSKDLVDFSSDSSDTPTTNISQVVFYGLHIVTPLISLELLKYPKLCHDYFSLLSHMLEVYPEMVGQLNGEAFTRVLQTLDFGLHHQDVDVVSMCLRALKALASYHYKETTCGRPGLGSQASSGSHPTGELKGGILSQFLRSLLHLLLFENYSSDLVGVAADALFPLILCEQGLYQTLGNELIQGQVNPNFRSRLSNAFYALTSANQLSSTLDRINCQRFRKNLTAFLIEVRGFMRTM